MSANSSTAPEVPVGLRWRDQQALWATLLGALAASCAFVIDPPPVPDLAAQVVRAHLAGSGIFAWWPGWFGGVSLPSYSPISPVLMSWIGVAVAGALSTVAAVIGASWLFRHTRRPALGLFVFAITVLIDMFCGRVTFALGFAGGVIALALLSERRTGWAAVVGGLAFLASPLAGLFLGIGALTVGVADRSRRRAALVLAGVLGGLAGLLQILSPQPGQMAFPWWHMAIVLVCLGFVALICKSSYLRWGCAIAAGATLLFFVVPGAVGTNMVRLIWLVAAPAAVACADTKRLQAVAAGMALLIWPSIDLSIQLAAASTPAATAAYYQPLVAALHDQQVSIGTPALGERVEVVNPATQWAAAYVPTGLPLARGWDRQLDRSDDALFYDGTLSRATYHHWLSDLAVGWVALPRAGKLDYASRAEATLVRQDPAYLRLVWQNPEWNLYRVRHATPLIQGGTLVSVTGRGVTFSAPANADVDLQLRWSPYLKLSSGAQALAAGCISEHGPWTRVHIPSTGTYTLGASLISAPRSLPTPCSS